MTYLTPDRFRTMGLGVDLSGIDDAELRAVLHRASASVDAHCNVPLLPSKHDFRGGTITDEQHAWVIDSQPRPYRFWPWHQPVKAVTSFRIYATPSVFLEIQPDDVFIHNSGGWVEVASIGLTTYGIFGAGVITSAIGLFEPIARVSYTYGRSFNVVDEPLTTNDELTYRAQNQWWSDADVTVKVDGATVTTGFTLDRDEGTVIFSAVQPTTALVTVSYTHTLPWEISQATGLIAAEDLGESQMRTRGMSGVDMLTVGEISIRRQGAVGMRGGSKGTEAIGLRAQLLLDDFSFVTVR